MPPHSEATASLILDVDRDGDNDFVIAGRQSPAMEWYRRDASGWAQYVIEDGSLQIEAGGALYDIDGDGDLDIAMGGDWRSNQVWLWENPYPAYDPDTPWVRRTIKDSGANKHHDQIFGDFDGDGQAELVFWNQGAQGLFLADIPSDPRNTQPWPYTEIYSSSSGSQHEGLVKADINGVQRASRPVSGGLSNWSPDYRLALANELTGNRPWLGEFYLVAIFDRALSSDEINQNFLAEPD